MGPPDTPQNLVNAFTEAKARWESIILNDLPGFEKQSSLDFDWFFGVFSSGYNEAVDDVVIGYAIQTFDGMGGILGRAGPVYIRNDDSPISGIMQFDIDDFSSDSYSDEDIKVIILHEMGKVTVCCVSRVFIGTVPIFVSLLELGLTCIVSSRLYRSRSGFSRNSRVMQ
jgi:hypothetical protein